MASSKFLTIISLVLIFGACSQKTQEAASSTANKVRNKEDRPKRGGPQQFSKLLEKMDTNNDGQISASEVQGRLKENFSQIDADSNGFITEEEMKNAPRPERRRKKQ